METFSKNMPCECADTRCPECHGTCFEEGTILLYRIDMEDASGTLMCEGCSQDALESGLYTESPQEEELLEE